MTLLILNSLHQIMTKRRVGVNEKTFKLMLLVCKNATPKADVELSIDVLKQMKNSGCKCVVVVGGGGEDV